MGIGSVAPFAAYLTVGLVDSEGKKCPSCLILEPGLLRRIIIWGHTVVELYLHSAPTCWGSNSDSF